MATDRAASDGYFAFTGSMGSEDDILPWQMNTPVYPMKHCFQLVSFSLCYVVHVVESETELSSRTAPL